MRMVKDWTKVSVPNRVDLEDMDKVLEDWQDGLTTEVDVIKSLVKLIMTSHVVVESIK